MKTPTLTYKMLTVQYGGMFSYVLDIRKHRLTHPMLKENMRDVLQVYVECVGGPAWINIDRHWLVYKERTI